LDNIFDKYIDIDKKCTQRCSPAENSLWNQNCSWLWPTWSMWPVLSNHRALLL